MKKKHAQFVIGRRHGWLLVALVGLAAAGCGRGGDPNLVQCNGTITFQGKPLSHGSINFYAPNSSGSSAIDDKGHYELRVLPGTYKVSIRSWDKYPGMNEIGETLPSKSLVPEKYGDIATSGLTAEVKTGGGRLDFNLAR